MMFLSMYFLLSDDDFTDIQPKKVLRIVLIRFLLNGPDKKFNSN